MKFVYYVFPSAFSCVLVCALVLSALAAGGAGNSGSWSYSQSFTPVDSTTKNEYAGVVERTRTLSNFYGSRTPIIIVASTTNNENHIIRTPTISKGDERVISYTPTLAVSFAGAPQTPSNTSDCLVLISQYLSLNGSGWVRQGGWNSSYDCCSNDGVSCYATGEVTALDLHADGLVGNFSALNLTSLSAIAYVNVSRNPFLGGTLPGDWATKASLIAIDLTGCGAVGPLPDEWAQWSIAETLLLGGNMLSSTVPSAWAAGFPALTTLDVSYNQLSGTLPPEWSNLSTSSLSLAGNMLTGTLPAAWGALPLQSLQLGANNLSGTLPPEWGNLTSLVTLGLEGNVLLQGTVPAEWGQLAATLQFVNFTGSGVVGPLPSAWTNTSTLVVVGMSPPSTTQATTIIAPSMAPDTTVAITSVPPPPNTTAAPITNPPSSDGGNSKSNVGIVILVIVIAAVVFAIGVCAYRKCNDGSPSRRGGAADVYQPPPYDNDAEMHRHNVAVAEIN